MAKVCTLLPDTFCGQNTFSGTKSIFGGLLIPLNDDDFVKGWETQEYIYDG